MKERLINEGKTIEITSINDKVLREKITQYVEDGTDGEYSESDYTWKDVLTAVRHPAEKSIRSNLLKKFGVTVDLTPMTPEQILKKYKIPEAAVEEIRTKRGREYDRRKQTSSIRNKRFVSELRDAIDEYGAPIKIDKQKVNTYNDRVARYNASHELEYEYLEGTIVNVTFKDSKGRTHVVSSYRSRLFL